MLYLYQAGGERYYQVINWWDHQQMTWAHPSKYPAPPEWVDRIRYNAKGNEQVKENWSKKGGFTTGVPTTEEVPTQVDTQVDTSQEPKQHNITQHNTIEDTNDGAEAPATPPSQRNGSPHHLRGWLELIRESKNRPATSRRMIEALYPYYTEADLPGYGRIGATAKRVSGWGRLIQYIWGLSQYEPQGDLMSYIETVHKNGGKASGDAQGDYGDFDFGG